MYPGGSRHFNVAGCTVYNIIWWVSDWRKQWYQIIKICNGLETLSFYYDLFPFYSFWFKLTWSSTLPRWSPSPLHVSNASLSICLQCVVCRFCRYLVMPMFPFIFQENAWGPEKSMTYKKIKYLRTVFKFALKTQMTFWLNLLIIIQL